MPESGTAGPPEAALCLSGGVDHLAHSHGSMLGLHHSFPPQRMLDVFLFISGSGLSASVRAAMAALRPVAVRTYSETDFRAAAPTRRSECFCNPSPADAAGRKLPNETMHFSYHGVQLWGVASCFGLVTAHERKRRLSLAQREGSTHTDVRAHLYRWVLRARPDLIFVPELIDAIRRKVSGFAGDPLTERHVWFRAGHVSDAVALVTRAAAPAYFSAWEELLGGCATLPPAAERQRSCRKRIQVNEEYGTECLIAIHLRTRAHVNITSSPWFRPTLVKYNATLVGRVGMVALPTKTPAYFLCPLASEREARSARSSPITEITG